MDALDRALLAEEVDALQAAVDEARFRHVAGMEGEPSLVACFEARPRAAHRRTVEALRVAGDGALADRVAALRAERAQAEDEEAWRAAEAATTVHGPAGRLPLCEADLALARERDRGRRLALGAAVASSAVAPVRERAVEKRALARAEVGLAPAWEEVVGGDALLSATDDAYRDVLGWLARREAELAPAPGGDLARADLLYVAALHGWEGLFPRGMLALTLEGVAAALKLDLSRVRVDDGSRAAQWAGVHVFGTRVSLRRQGGAADWLGMFDAAGQALAAAVHPVRSRHPAAGHAAGALLAGLLLDRGFLATRLQVDRKQVPDLARALSLRQLFRLRAAAAALRVATEVERGTSGAAWHERHREALSLAALASWPTGLAARDADAGALLARLRGAARAEALRRDLVERHDEDWWRNPRAADAIGSLLVAGGAWVEEEPALAVGTEWMVKLMQ